MKRGPGLTAGLHPDSMTQEADENECEGQQTEWTL